MRTYYYIMIITLTDIEFHAYHGVLPQERQVGGLYVVEVSLTVPDEQSTETDSLEHTVNYAEVYEVVKEEMAIPSKLIEHVAGRIARRIRTEFPLVSQVRLSVTKKHPPIAGANINAKVELCI